MLLIKLVYFCGEEETVNNFFFDCCVASLMWNSISMEVCVLVGSDFESIGRWWISNNKNTVLNCVCAATLWSIWKLHNHLCFEGGRWQEVGRVLCSIARMLMRWCVLLKPNKQAKLQRTAQHLLGGVKTADDPMGHFFTIAIVNPGSVMWGSLPVGLRNYSSNRADVVWSAWEWSCWSAFGCCATVSEL